MIRAIIALIFFDLEMKRTLGDLLRDGHYCLYD